MIRSTRWWFAFSVLVVITRSLPAAEEIVPTDPVLPHSSPLVLDEPLYSVMTRGIGLFAERELARQKEQRTAPWLNASTEEDRAPLRQAARDEFKSIIGFPPEEVPVSGTIKSVLSLSSRPIKEQDPPQSLVVPCQWDAFEGVTGRGLISIPIPIRSHVSFVVVIPDAGQSPEQLFGTEEGIERPQQIARLLAEQGCVVLCPVLIDRDFTWSGHPDLRWTNIPHRELIYRVSFELGRHPIGYEVAKVLSGIRTVQEAFRGWPLRTAVVGTGDGGLIALAAGAIDEETIQAVVVRNYFNERERVWEEPIDRNLFGQLKKFGDAELASLIAPRPLIIDHISAPNAQDVDVVLTPEKRAHVAAPGLIRTLQLESVKREFARAQQYYQKAGAGESITLLTTEDAEKGIEEIVSRSVSLAREPAADQQTQQHLMLYNSTAFPDSKDALALRMKSQVEELVRYSQTVLHRSDKVRAAKWKEVNLSSLEAFAKSNERYRNWVHESFIGKLTPPTVPLNPRTRKVLDEPEYVGYEVVLDVYPAPASSSEKENDWGVIAGGWLLIPKDLKEGEKRPVVVFQHGLEGSPEDTLIADRSSRKWRAYQEVSAELVKRGFIVYAPQNPYKGFDDFRVLQRKSNPSGYSLFSYIIEQHRQSLRWLAGLPYVDPSRIAFYGISYGGKTAVRVPTLLVPTDDQPGYCLSICSADYNDWIRKIASSEDRYSYVYTGEYEIFEWNMGHIANYAELTWLMIPRPFMIERGHDDGVAPDEWVAWEYAKARRAYVKLGISDLTEIEYFDGPHAIHGVGTYQFLHRHLNWPEK
ncbi:MAG TPA: hypothetical protein VNQ76_02385 [Planctomicrobium sp.]|nr:hypothetical protein [Planctomicrobium sp.]